MYKKNEEKNSKLNQNKNEARVSQINENYIVLFIKNLVTMHITNLGDDLADGLFEIEKICSTYDRIAQDPDKYGPREISLTNGISLDKLTEGLDNILHIHILSIQSECQNFINKANLE